MADALRMLLSLSLSGTGLALLVAGLTRLLRGRVSQSFQCALWLVVVLRFLLPVGSTWSIAHQAVQSQEWVLSGLEQAPGLPAPAPPLPDARRAAAVSAAPILAAGWAVGAVGTALWRLGGYAAFRRRVLAGAHPAHETALLLRRLAGEWGRVPRVLVSPQVGVPMLLGVVQPCILLPEGPCELELLTCALQHELIHWRRRHLWLKWLGAAVCCVHWFNPVAWRLPQRLDRACELSCDEAVVRGRTREERRRYGALLLSLAAGERVCSDSASACLCTEKYRLKERLVYIMSPNEKRKSAPAWMAGAVLAVALCSVVLGAYAGQVEAEPQRTAAQGPESPAASAEQLSWVWPVEQEETVLTNLFGSRVHPLTGRVTRHSGVDIKLEQDAPVLAAAAGTVADTGFDRAGGNYVELSHGGVTTRYEHLSAVGVEEGEQVAAGQQIGTGGKTGTVTGCCLHFEVREDETSVDPLRYYPGVVPVTSR